MNDLLIRIQPDLPIAWEALDTLRIGFDRAEVRLTKPSPSVQRFLSMLRAGVLSSELAAAARRAGLAGTERRTLLERLSAALVYEAVTPETTSPPFNPAISVRGTGTLAETMHHELLLSGYAKNTDGAKPDFALIVGRFSCPAPHSQALLQSETPHMPVRVTDRSLLIGPLVPEYGTPCLACIELHDRARRPHEIVLAAQLCDADAGAETESVCRFAASVMIMLIEQWIAGCTELIGRRLRYRVSAGVPSAIPEIETFEPHPDCACSATQIQHTQGLSWAA